MMFRVRHEYVTLFGKQICVLHYSLRYHREQVVELLESSFVYSQRQPASRPITQKTHILIVVEIDGQLFRSYLRVVALNDNLAWMANRFLVNQVIQRHYGDFQKLALLAFHQIQLYLLYVVSIGVSEVEEGLLLLVFDQLVASPLQDA